MRSIARTIFFIIALSLSSIEGVFALVFAHESSYSESIPADAYTVDAFVPLRLSAAYPDTSPKSPYEGVALTTEAGIDTVMFSGIAYPGALITVLDNGKTVASTPANINGTFSFGFRYLNPGSYNFSLRTTDSYGVISSLVPIYVYVKKGETTVISNIILPPTISSYVSTARFGDSFDVYGAAVPGSVIRMFVDEGNATYLSTTTDDGVWRYRMDSRQLSMGEHEFTAVQYIGDLTSPLSSRLLIDISSENILRSSTTPHTSISNPACDINNDGLVDIRDFSILSYWYGRKPFPNKVDLNKDSSLDLQDFSIIAFCWTG